ncbi:MAG: serine/threonine-protein kinase [Nocardioides sp.]
MQPELIGGRYRVLRAIGRGGMGTVWLARDETLAREVAAKEVGLLPGQSVTDTARAMREARSTAALNHRNVVTVFDVVEEDSRIWLVMEHVPSRSLAAVIREDGALPPGLVASLGAQVADGLAAAHRAGITHRDVKPGNIFLADDGLAKIGDFGISRTQGDPALTESDLVTGTPTYFSPELATGADPSPSADVWALGATLYYAVEGRPPYQQRDNPMAVLHDIAQVGPPPPRRAGPLEPVLVRMLDRDPGTRWSMEDVAHALHRLAEGSREHTAAFDDDAPTSTFAAPLAAGAGLDDRPETTDPVDDEGSPRRRRPGPALIGVLAVVAAVLAILLIDPLGADDPGERTAEEPGGQSAGAEAKRSPGAEDTTEETPDQASDSPDEAASPTPEESTPVDASEAATFVDGYYDTLPDDTEAGWQMLSPGYQDEVGRSSYDGFWATISSVDAQDLEAVDDGNAVEATIVFVNDAGETLTEQHRLAVVDEGDGLRIAGDELV